MDRSFVLDSTKCKNAIRVLNGTDNPQLNPCISNNSFAFFDVISKQNLLEKQRQFEVKKLNTCLQHMT